MKRLLIENIGTIQYTPPMLIEAIDINGRMHLKGVIQRADVPNQNKRIYPKKLLVREEQKYLPKMKERRAFGELDHPESNVINLKNVSHIMTETWWEGNDLCGLSEILNTPSGRILQELVKSGCTVGISSRGLGSTERFQEGEDDDVEEVLEDFELLCWDFVSDPSTHEAYMRPMQEGKLVTENKFTNKQYTVNDLISGILCELGNQCCLS